MTSNPATPSQPTPSQPTPDPAAPRRLSRDPLSVFLLVAVAVMGLMYYLDTRHASILASSLEQAQAFEREVAQKQGCRVGSTGQKGRVWTVACPDMPVAALKEWLSPPAKAGQLLVKGGAQRLWLMGQDERLECVFEPEGLDCRSHAVLSGNPTSLKSRSINRGLGFGTGAG